VTPIPRFSGRIGKTAVFEATVRFSNFILQDFIQTSIFFELFSVVLYFLDINQCMSRKSLENFTKWNRNVKFNF